jgi:hypothetical protein
MSAILRPSQWRCKSKDPVGRRIIGPYLTVSKRMGSGDNLFFYQRFKTLIRSVKPTLYLKSMPPVLLPFPTQVRQPPAFAFLCGKTFKYCFPVGPKPPPMRHRTHRVYRATVRTSPSLYPHRIRYLVEEPAYISMPPDTISVTANTPSGTRPGICFPKCL